MAEERKEKRIFTAAFNAAKVFASIVLLFIMHERWPLLPAIIRKHRTNFCCSTLSNARLHNIIYNVWVIPHTYHLSLLCFLFPPSSRLTILTSWCMYVCVVLGNCVADKFGIKKNPALKVRSVCPDSSDEHARRDADKNVSRTIVSRKISW